MLMPFVGKSYAQCLADVDLVLRHGTDGFSVWAHGEHKLPVQPESEKALLQQRGSGGAAVEALSHPRANKPLMR